MKGEEVELVSDYKYLGVNLDCKLNWHTQASSVFSKSNKKLYFVRKLCSFNVDKTLISLFCKSTIISIVSFCLAAYGGNIRKVDKIKIDGVLKKISKMSNRSMVSFDDLFYEQCTRNLKTILNDCTHPLFSQIKTSAHSGCLLHIHAKRERYKNSFLPTAIRHFCS